MNMLIFSSTFTHMSKLSRVTSPV